MDAGGVEGVVENVKGVPRTREDVDKTGRVTGAWCVRARRMLTRRWVVVMVCS